MVDEQLQERISSINKIPGQAFNLFFKDIKQYIVYKKNIDETFKEEINKIDKSEVIIFSLDKEKIDDYQLQNKKLIFPFNKIFIEYPMTIGYGHQIEYFTHGFLLYLIKDKNNEIAGIMSVAMCLDRGVNPGEEGLTPKIMLIPYTQLNTPINKIKIDDYSNSFTLDFNKKTFEILKKVIELVQNKQYTEYYKWTPSGIESKQIVYSHEVKSHKRHYWIDSGKFKIALLNKEEVINKGYEIDELVFRGNELRRDVPYKIIGEYIVGRDKEINKNNRIINLLKSKIFRNEQKLGEILSRLYPNELIKKHDRRAVKPLELDYHIINLKLAFEYDGEQHFDKDICENVFHSNFEELQKRDRKKDILCRNKGINLIRVKFDEDMGINMLKRKIKERYGKN